MRIQFTHQTKNMENTTFLRLSISTWLAQLDPPTNPTLDNFTCLFDISDQTCLSQGWAYTFSCQHIQKNWDLDSTLKLYSEVGDMNLPTSHCNITARRKRLQRGGSTQTTWLSSIWNEIWFSWDLDLVIYLWRSVHSTEKWATLKSRREQRE